MATEHCKLTQEWNTYVFQTSNEVVKSVQNEIVAYLMDVIKRISC